MADGEAVVFNQEQLLASCGEDDELATQVAMVFLTDIPRQLDNLDAAITGGEAKVAERVMHSIKGAAATVGGDRLRSCAFECEQLAHAGQLDELAGRLPEIRSLFTALRDALEDAGFGG